MDGDWDEVARISLPPAGLVPQGPQAAVTALTFDTTQNLLWTGNGTGRVTSFYGNELRRYTSLKAHKTGAVHQLLVSDKGIVALGSNYVHMSSRSGPTLWHLELPEFQELRCMSFTSKGTLEILVAGWQNTMFVIDLTKGEVTKRLPTDNHYSIMKRSRYICAATKTGIVNLLDPMSLTVVKTWIAHSAMINNMDAQHDFIVTCGFSLRGGQNYMLDPFLNVFDIKKMSSTPPIPFPAGAAFVRMHPRMSTTSIVVSQQGQMHVLDLVNPNTSNVRQANVLSFLCMFDIAPSGEALALADVDGHIHLWGSPSKICFVDFPTPTPFADPVEVPQVDWTPNTPFNAIGMPYYRDTLLSAWPPTVSEVGAPPVKFEPQFLDTLAHADFGLYGHNSRGLRRNQLEKTRKAEKSIAPGIQAPKFLSEKARESANASGAPPSEDRAEDAITNFASTSSSEVPVMYRNVEIKYSKFGVDDFDFGYYNKTQYSGLEIHIANSYANPLLQLLHFTPVIRNLALHHASTSCVDEYCLLCEMGFLFDMLQKAEGSICQATNLLKTLSNHPQAGPLGLLEEDPHGSSYATMLQGLTRFLLDRMVQDFRSIPPKNVTTTLEQVLATEATSHIRCTKCANEYTRPGSTFANDLIYPPMILPRNQKYTKPTFSQVLKASTERETTSKGWCNRCQRYQTLSTRKTIRQAPSVLMLNTAIRDADQSQLWCTPGWVPDEIGIIVDQGQFFCYEGDDLRHHLQRGFHNIRVYSLTGLAVNITGTQGQNPHLVGIIDVSHSQPKAPEGGPGQWHLFNDFLVQPISKDEALGFASWKIPYVLAFQLKDANNKVDCSWKQNLDTSLLYLGPRVDTGDKDAARALDPKTEHPTSKTIVALDTEFVAVRQPEIEVNSDGERETIRPIVYALARVSVIRGQGEDEGVPFIDDYVAVKEPIVDYLTSYSGITRADLDPRLSKRNLVSLKTAYKKIWILLNSGCRILGHGLKQDFRVINIHVPRAQVVDTIDLFFLRSRLRRLSLAFLAWCLLKEDIQLETHDSIEDARTALGLYRKFLEFQDAGILETMLQDIYRRGREVNFKPPRREGTESAGAGAVAGAGAETPPLPESAGGPPRTPSKGSSGVGFGGRSGWTPGKGSGSPFR